MVRLHRVAGLLLLAAALGLASASSRVQRELQTATYGSSSSSEHHRCPRHLEYERLHIKLPKTFTKNNPIEPTELFGLVSKEAMSGKDAEHFCRCLGEELINVEQTLFTAYFPQGTYWIGAMHGANFGPACIAVTNPAVNQYACKSEFRAVCSNTRNSGSHSSGSWSDSSSSWGSRDSDSSSWGSRDSDSSSWGSRDSGSSWSHSGSDSSSWGSRDSGSRDSGSRDSGSRDSDSSSWSGSRDSSSSWGSRDSDSSWGSRGSDSSSWGSRDSGSSWSGSRDSDSNSWGSRDSDSSSWSGSRDSGSSWSHSGSRDSDSSSWSSDSSSWSSDSKCGAFERETLRLPKQFKSVQPNKLHVLISKNTMTGKEAERFCKCHGSRLVNIPQDLFTAYFPEGQFWVGSHYSDSFGKKCLAVQRPALTAWDCKDKLRAVCDGNWSGSNSRDSSWGSRDSDSSSWSGSRDSDSSSWGSRDSDSSSWSRSRSSD